VRNRSFSTDLHILLETIRVLLLKARAPEIDTENRGAQS